MSNIEDCVRMTVENATLVASLAMNTFVFSVTAQRCAKNKNFKISDQIIFGMCSSNILNVVLHLFEELFLLLEKLPADIFFQVMISISIVSSLWFSTGLCMLYCLEFVHLKQKIYIRLQRCFPKMFPKIYIPFIMGFILVSCPYFMDGTEKASRNKTTEDPSKNASVSHEPHHGSFNLSAIFLAACAVAFILLFSSVSLINISLYRHIKRIKHNTGENGKNPNMEDYVSGAKIVTLLLTIHVLYFVNLLLGLHLGQNKYTWYKIIIFSTCYITCALILIKEHNKMEKTVIRWSHCFCTSYGDSSSM